MRDREAERLEEEEVRRNLPIYIGEHGALPRELQHLSMAINRLASRGVIVLLTNGHGRRWADAFGGSAPPAGERDKDL